VKRLFGSFAYSAGPRTGCWWDETCDLPDRPALSGTRQFDIVIVGGGFTGISAALHLAEQGVSVAVVEAAHVGWGASGRNGGFCCLGGGIKDNAALDRRFGPEGRAEYRKTELAAIELVAGLIDRLGLDVDRHSDGGTELAHRPHDMDDLHIRAETATRDYGVAVELTERRNLLAHGLNGPFHGALTIRAGFGLNPRKYLAGIAAVAEQSGAVIYENSGVVSIGDNCVVTRHGQINAKRIVIATNGYSSDDLPAELSGRYLPSQSNVLVTRPLTDAEIASQGWHSDQMAYDTRHLLHYFRLMPDRRFLFGMRGGLISGASSELRARRKTREHFEQMFPAWRSVDTPHNWSGMVCLARAGLPFVGALPGPSGVFAGLCYHGNGVAMGSYAGALLADLVQGKTPELRYPDAMRQPLRRFGLGRLRRLVMPGAYAAFMLADR